MSSKIVDPEVTEEVVEEQVDISLEALAVEDEVEEEVIQEEAELPKKFQGKSSTEIVEAYENLEKELGRKGQEIGELRKLTDSYLQSQISTQAETTTTSEPADFYDNPEQAVRQIIDNHPRFKEMKEQNEKQTASLTAQQLEKAHPDFQEVIGDGGFQEWVNGSKIRQRLYKEADSYDFDAADELLTNWKERQMISKTKEVNESKKVKRDTAMKAGEAMSNASGESTAGKKIYRRADLIRLKQTDPRRYEDLADEIYQAYADGRVK
jgi:hypothetical protein|tara:strand:- start:295 stop:1092 length:798 start_codon:yes stop_codon:yes gene_type:complete